MSRIVISADNHIAQHKKSFDRLNHCLGALEWVFQTAQANNISDVVFAGDLFQDRQRIDVIAYHLTYNLITKYVRPDFRLWLLLGNHDLWFNDRWDVSSVHPLASVPGLTVIDRPCRLDVAGHPVSFLPYTHDPVKHVRDLLGGAAGYATLVGHLAVDGAKLNTLHNTLADVIVEHDGEMVKVGPDVFDGWDKVWLGHYHGEQQVSPTVEYVGSPLQLSFGEAFQHKHVALYDLATGQTEYVRNKISPQHFIIPEADIDKYDLANNFIRIQAADMNKAEAVDMRRAAQQAGAGTVEIIPAKVEADGHVVADAKLILADEGRMLEEYIRQVRPEGLSADVLAECGRQICQLANDPS